MLPSLVLIKREFPTLPGEGGLGQFPSSLSTCPALTAIMPGQSVAIGVGSRGISSLQEIVSAVVTAVRARGAEPFIVPCMGSHGGATAEGQIAVLHSLGVSEETVGCPIRSGMDTISLGATPTGIPVVVDSLAAQADHVIPVNRVKPHTDFHGAIQSGLIKMLAIGLGNHSGARRYHNAFAAHGFTKTIRSVYRVVTRRLSIPFGVAIVEGEGHQPLRVEAVPAAGFPGTERRLLRLAKQHLARLPDVQLDLLIVDQIGKEISGSGMDTNVVGLKPPRWCMGRTPLPPLIYLRGLSAETHGNAVGIGLASTVHQRILEQVDWSVTYTNCLTSGSPRGAASPMPFPSDREAIERLSDVLGKEPHDLRIARIRDTLSLQSLYVSRSVLSDIAECEPIHTVEDACPVSFDEDGNLSPDLTPIR